MLEVRGWFFADGDKFMASQMASGGRYQRSHLVAAIELTKNFRTAVDGGAHVGTWSIPMAERFRSVVAFEPSRDTFEALRANLERQGSRNVTAINAALGRQRGKVRMTLDGFPRAIALENLGARFVAKGGDIDAGPLDELDLRDLDFLKLDVEGSEPDAIVGATETLKRCKPTILFEDKFLWRRYGYDRYEPQRLLTNLGARQLKRIKMDEIWGWP